MEEMRAHEQQEAWGLPDLMQVLLEPQQWSLVSSLCPPDASPIDGSRYAVALQVARVHFDPCPQVNLFLRGTGGFCIEGTTYPIRPGSVFLVDPMLKHGYEFDEPLQPGDLYRVNVLRGYYLVRLWCHRGGQIQMGATQDELVTDVESGVLLDKHWMALQQSALPPEHVRTRVIAALTLLTSAIAERHLGEQTRDLQDFQREVVEAVRRHISEMLHRKHTLGELSRIAGYSKFHFARIFRVHTGQSIHDYIDTCRLSKVRDLSRHGLTVKETAAALGFSSPNAFVRWRRDQRARGQDI